MPAVTRQPSLRRGTWIIVNPLNRLETLSPLRSGDDHIRLPAAALGTDQPLTPIENRFLRTISISYLSRIRLDLVAARLAPHDEPNAGRSRIAERHRRAGW